ncbi:uncharacterized protein LOC141854245 [Brevipalpus obovatus]|uniref:uncharacterized protein LOC141854245 n=1 Tax=Brevipalpus obovatus TaxID=246614 RepID=UPI003D9EE0F3
MDVESLDYYEFLKIERGATIDQINKAYRRRTLEYHPDKNPDDPSAKQKFEKLQEIVEILRDPVQRSDYDRKLKARDEKRVKDKELDATRRKYKENLERREKDSKEEENRRLAQDVKRQKEIEIVRKINSQLLEDENEKLRKKIERDLSDVSNRISLGDHPIYSITVEWDGPVRNNTLSLTNIFSRFGKISNLLIQGQTATFEFSDRNSVLAALSAKIENVAIRRVQISIRTSSSEKVSAKSPYGIKSGQTFDDFEKDVLEKMKTAKRYQNMARSDSQIK